MSGSFGAAAMGQSKDLLKPPSRNPQSVPLIEDSNNLPYFLLKSIT
jgi:hypothetical protein